MIETPFNYTGSKFKLLPQILPEMDYSKKYFVDLFSGGGSVYTNVLDKYYKILVNDIIKELIDIHRNILLSDDIINKTMDKCPNKESKEEFLYLRKEFNSNKTPEGLWALMLSCTNNLMRFNKKGEFNQTWGKRTWNSNTDKKVDVFKNHIRKYKNKINFLSTHFKNIKINKPSMVYIDPPYGYIETDGKIQNKQISEAGYNSYYYQSDDITLYEYIKELDGNGSSFMISGVLEHGNNVSWILNNLIKDGFKYKILDFDYNKVSRKKSDKNTKEVIITNY